MMTRSSVLGGPSVERGAIRQGNCIMPVTARPRTRLWPTWGRDIDGLSRIDLDEFFDGRPVVLESVRI